MAHPSNRLPGPDRRRQIIAVAMELFARRGFRGTTTKQIAQRAAVNEAILFRHFPRKEDLYWAVLEEKCRSVGARQQLEVQIRATANENHSRGTDQRDIEMFSAIAEGILRRNTQDSTLSRLLLFSALNNHRLTQRFFRTHVAGYYEVLALHIRKRIRAGAFRRVDPLLAARGFIGMVFYHFLIQELFGGRRYQLFDLREVCHTLAEIWLHGMRVSQNHAGISAPRAAAKRLRQVQRVGDFRLGPASIKKAKTRARARGLTGKILAREQRFKTDSKLRVSK